MLVERLAAKVALQVKEAGTGGLVGTAAEAAISVTRTRMPN